MPLLPSNFKAPLAIRSGDLQSIIPALFRRVCPITTERENLELDDGDLLELEWLRRGSGRLAIISHGLEGSTRSSYVQGLARALSDAGWDILTWSMRGCGSSPNRLVTWYHSGETRDLSSVIAFACTKHAGPIALVGFSVGGNITLKYLAENPSKLPPNLCKAAVVSVPMDLRGSAEQLALPRNRIYMEYLLRPLRRRIEEKARRFPELFDAQQLRGIKTFYDFDRLFTAPFHGFGSVEEYWSLSSSLAYLADLSTPILAISALDDPFLSPSCIPTSVAKSHRNLYLETPTHGGHVGFIDSYSLRRTWLEGRIVGFLEGTIE